MKYPDFTQISIDECPSKKMHKNANATASRLPEHLTHPKYRPDIDGLRAIAVLSVVGFHAFPRFIQGGFVGVDIFFVISGFLISTIIFENLERNSFSFLEFYSRRIKRIFPALLIVLIVSYAAGWFILFADEYRQFGKHVIGGAGFISNILLLRESGYFDSGVDSKPLLHLWSLGIEEQFYIAWPLLLWAGWRQKFNWLALVVVIATVSFILNIWQIKSNATIAFYSPQTRFWELLIGSGLAYATIANSRAIQKVTLAYGAILSVIGIGLIAAGVFFTTSEKSFPGWWALLPTIGTALVIMAGSGAWINRTILSNKMLVWFGLISFPLYLWHWPLLSFARILNGEIPSTDQCVIAVLCAIALAWLTYKIIEIPIRKNPSKNIIIFLSFGMSVAFVVGAITYFSYGFADRKVNEPFKDSNARTTLLSRLSDKSCANEMNLTLAPEEVCLTNSKNPKVLFVGDSHAMALYSAIYAGKSALKDTLLVSGHTCMPYADLEYKAAHINNYGNNCTNIAKEAIQRVNKSNSLSTVVIVNHAPEMEVGKQSIYSKNGTPLEEPEAFYEGNRYFINEILKAGKKVVYMVGIPKWNYQLNDCEKRIPFIAPKDCTLEKAAYIDSRKIYLDKLKQLKNTYPMLEIFDPTEVFCKNGSCNPKDGKEYLYQDIGHLSLYGSQKVLDLLSKRIN